MGTQSAKAILLDGQGVTRARAGRAYPTHHAAPGWAEQDARDWLTALREAVAEAIGIAGAGPEDIAGIGVAAQVDGIVPVGRDDEPLGRAPIWMDRRATRELEDALRRIGVAEVRDLSGANADPSHGAPKILWLRNHEDEPADAYLMPASFVVAHLTGRRTIDRTNASTLLLLDVATGAWSRQLVEAFRIDTDVVGELALATDVAGGILPGVATAWGLPAGCPVVVGCGDEHAACLAAGALQPGVIADVTGTAEPIAAGAADPVRDHEGLLETHAHVPPGRWLIEHPGFVSGGSVRWLAEEVLGCRQAEIGQLAAGVTAGADGVRFLPALGGASTPRWNAQVFGAFTGLAVGHDRRHLARAVLEGCTFALRDVIERLDAVGLGAAVLRVVGGGALDREWLQIKADVTGRSIEVLCEPEATALGAALIAAVGVGWYPDLDAASAATLRVDAARYDPEPAVKPLYDEAWAAYRATFDALEPVASAHSS